MGEKSGGYRGVEEGREGYIGEDEDIGGCGGRGEGGDGERHVYNGGVV